MVRIVIKGKAYERIALASVLAGGPCYIIYSDGDEDNGLCVLHFDFEDVDEWVVTKEAETDD